jgi:hypothetical protein
LLPLSPLGGDLGAADLAVLERYADPRALTRAGQAELTAVITKASHGHQGAGRACQWLDAARASLELYGGHPAVDFAGLAEAGGPALAACMGDPARFATGKKFRRYTGLAPRASQTGETDRKGQPMPKAGSPLLRTTLVRAADTARKQDPSSPAPTTSR